MSDKNKHSKWTWVPRQWQAILLAPNASEAKHNFWPGGFALRCLQLGGGSWSGRNWRNLTLLLKPFRCIGPSNCFVVFAARILRCYMMFHHFFLTICGPTPSQHATFFPRSNAWARKSRCTHRRLRQEGLQSAHYQYVNVNRCSAYYKRHPDCKPRKFYIQFEASHHRFPGQESIWNSATQQTMWQNFARPLSHVRFADQSSFQQSCVFYLPTPAVKIVNKHYISTSM